MVERGVVSAYGDPGRIRPGVVDRYWELLRAPGNRSGMRQLARTMEERPARSLEVVRPFLADLREGGGRSPGSGG